MKSISRNGVLQQSMPEKNTKRILYLTFYFEPDLCAGSFRNSPLAKELAVQTTGKNIEIDLFTTHPNRYSSFREKAQSEEVFGNLRVRRFELPPHQNRMVDQIISFSSYYNQVMKEIIDRDYDLVFASSSRLFTGFLGARIAKKKNAFLYLDIRDLFLDTLSDLIQNKLFFFLVSLPLRIVQRYTYKSAGHINLISPGFESDFQSYRSIPRSLFTHGIDDEFLTFTERFPSTRRSGNSTLKILYAGNIGEGQGLEKIIPPAALKLGEKIEFKVIGDGGTRHRLQKECDRLNLSNVTIIKPLARIKLLKEYDESDLLLIHLNDYRAFKKVLPSKIFELGATGKTIIAGVAGYSKVFIAEQLPDSLLFAPGDFEAFILLLKEFALQDRATLDRSDFLRSFNRKQINRKIVKSILGYL